MANRFFKIADCAARLLRRRTRAQISNTNLCKYGRRNRYSFLLWDCVTLSAGLKNASLEMHSLVQQKSHHHIASYTIVLFRRTAQALLGSELPGQF